MRLLGVAIWSQSNQSQLSAAQYVALLPNVLMDVQPWQEAHTQIPTVALLLVHKGNICNE